MEIAVVVIIAIALFIVVSSIRSSSGKPSRDKLAAKADWLISKAWGASDEQAEELFKQAFTCAEQAREGLLCSEAACKLGELYMKLRKYEEAVIWFSKASRCRDNPGWRPDKPNFAHLIDQSLAEALHKAELGRD